MGIYIFNWKVLRQELILDENKAERHIRGGMATKLKYDTRNKAS